MKVESSIQSGKTRVSFLGAFIREKKSSLHMDTRTEYCSYFFFHINFLSTYGENFVLKIILCRILQSSSNRYPAEIYYSFISYVLFVFLELKCTIKKRFHRNYNVP